MADVTVRRLEEDTGEALVLAGGFDELAVEFLRGRSEQTVRSYRADLVDFARFLGIQADDAGHAIAQAAQLLLGPRDHGHANRIARAYRNHLVADRKLSPAGTNRKLAALRSLVAMARENGVVPFKLAVRGEKAESYRDTRGPGVDGFLALLEQAEHQRTPRRERDVAILWLLFSAALRRVEVCRLNVDDVDLDAGVVKLLGKGRKKREPFTLSPEAVEALRAWMVVREHLDVEADDGDPLFVNLSRAYGRTRMTGKAVWLVVKHLAKGAGIEARPHGLRHAGVTAALDLAGGDVRAVQRFSRHRDLRVLLTYDDNRQDLGGAIAKKVGAAARERREGACA